MPRTPVTLATLLVLGASIEAVRAQNPMAGPETPAHAYSGPIIDMHLHSYTEGRFASGPGPNPVTGSPAPVSARDHMERSIEVMRQYNVVLGVVSGQVRASVDAWHLHAPDMTLRGVQMGDPGVFLNPETFRSLLQTGEIDVLGEVVAQYAGFSPSDPAYAPYWAVAQEHGLPVAIHTGQSFPGTPYLGGPEVRLRYGDPHVLEDMLVEFPDLKVYMMHAGGGWTFSEHA